MTSNTVSSAIRAGALEAAREFFAPTWRLVSAIARAFRKAKR